MPITDTPRVYISCLACYNDGRLHGKWVDADDADVMQDTVTELQDKCGHVDNDWAIHDYEGFAGFRLGESESFTRVAALVKNIDEHGEAFAIYVNHVGADWDDESGFLEAYNGHFSSREDFAQHLAEEIGAIDRDAKWPYTCIDWEFAAKELFYDYWEEDGHVFRSL